MHIRKLYESQQAHIRFGNPGRREVQAGHGRLAKDHALQSELHQGGPTCAQTLVTQCALRMDIVKRLARLSAEPDSAFGASVIAARSRVMENAGLPFCHRTPPHGNKP
jgi:hypothetical protein